MFSKISIETAFNAELDDRLDYSRYEQSSVNNGRNIHTRKTLQTGDRRFELDIPRNRQDSFESEPVKKHQCRFASMDDKILFLYTWGMSTREIATTFKEMYSVLSATRWLEYENQPES